MYLIIKCNTGGFCMEHPELALLNNDLDVKPSTATIDGNEVDYQPLVKQQLSTCCSPLELVFISGNSSTKHMVFVEFTRCW